MGVQVSFSFGNFRLILRAPEGHTTGGGSDEGQLTEAVVKDSQGIVLGRRVFHNALELVAQLFPGVDPAKYLAEPPVHTQTDLLERATDAGPESVDVTPRRLEGETDQEPGPHTTVVVVPEGKASGVSEDKVGGHHEAVVQTVGGHPVLAAGTLNLRAAEIALVRHAVQHAETLAAAAAMLGISARQLQTKARQFRVALPFTAREARKS